MIWLVSECGRNCGTDELIFDFCKTPLPGSFSLGLLGIVWLHYSVLVRNSHFLCHCTLGLVPSGIHDITQLESWGEPSVPALRFLTPGMG